MKRPLSSRLGVERHADPVVPDDLDQVRAAATKDVEIAAMRVTAERLLHLQRQECMPRRISVWPTASQTRTPEGVGIIRAAPPARGAGPPR